MLRKAAISMRNLCTKKSVVTKDSKLEMSFINGAKYHVGKVKSQDNAGQRSFDPGGLGQLC